MTNYINIDGINIPLTDEQIKEIQKNISNCQKTIFDRCELGETYYYISGSDNGKVISKKERFNEVDNLYFENCNYCSDIEILKQRALHEKLNRLLWKESVLSGELDNPWVSNLHYCIIYDESKRKLTVDSFRYLNYVGGIYFKTREAAQNAIDNIIIPFMKEHPEFIF